MVFITPPPYARCGALMYIHGALLLAGVAGGRSQGRERGKDPPPGPRSRTRAVGVSSTFPTRRPRAGAEFVEVKACPGEEWPPEADASGLPVMEAEGFSSSSDFRSGDVAAGLQASLCVHWGVCVCFLPCRPKEKKKIVDAEEEEEEETPPPIFQID